MLKKHDWRVCVALPGLLLFTIMVLIFYSRAVAASATAAPSPADHTPTPMPASATPSPLTAIGSDTPLVSSAALQIYGLRLGPSNAYLIETKAGITLVDAGLPTSARRILRALESLGRADDLCQIFITHAHIDHYGAAAELHKQTGAPIIVHADDAADLAAGRSNLGSVRNWDLPELPVAMVERLITIRKTTPTRTVTDGEAMTDCGLDATVIHTPGHTAGSSTLLVRDASTGATYAFVGDLLSTTGGLHVQGSYAQDWSRIAPSLAVVQALAPDLTFPGHGSTAITLKALQQYVPSGPAAPAH